MKLGITVYSNDPETVWNAFRLANFTLTWGDSVKMFMIGKGVEFEFIGNEKFDVTGQLKTYLDAGGKILACGTCLQIRQMKPTEKYVVATLKELHGIITESDKVVTF